MCGAFCPAGVKVGLSQGLHFLVGARAGVTDWSFINPAALLVIDCPYFIHQFFA